MGNVVIVKLRNKGDRGTQKRLIEKLVGAALAAAEPLFPDDDEPDLCTLYEVRLRENASTERALETLAGNPEVEYAHEPAERKTV
jgi:hypothetical protein